MSIRDEVNSMVKEAQIQYFRLPKGKIPSDVDNHIWDGILGRGRGQDEKARQQWLRRWEGLAMSRLGLNPNISVAQARKALPAMTQRSKDRFDALRGSSGKDYREIAKGLSMPDQTQGGFDFSGEAKKMLGNLRSRYGTFENKMTRDFTSQWRDMQRNPGQYDDARKRQILQQWKDRVAQFERGRAAGAKNVAASQNRQAIVAPKTRASLGTGWSGRQVVQGGSAPASRVQVATQSNLMAHNAVTGKGGQTLYRNAQGQNVALSELPSSKMQWWNQTKFDTSTPEGRNAYYASYLPGSMRTKPMAGVSPYVAKNNGNGGDRPSKEREEKTRQFGDA